MPNSRRANRLIKEKSPYLLQHAYNPVDWYPWGEEAFAKAKAEDKPIFLSIGYSTCHWCHVMERESFEDEEVAALLNKHFISVKVDREERPDIDQIYMTACQAMTGQGGWPLTVLLTPEKQPFFAGSYFPKQSRYGRPGLMDILAGIAKGWQQSRSQLLELAHELVTAIQRQEQHSPGRLKEDVFHKAFQNYQRSFDSEYGGFGSAPKFPAPHNLMFLLRYYRKYQQPAALAMVEKTLQAMYRGGIYDHIGFGFSRYSTDELWLVPHFEKMLYDNALLAISYLETYQVTKNPLYKQVAESIFTYVLRDMTAPEGGFFSAEDADSEGVEGKFYVWTPQEVIDVLGQQDGAKYNRHYDISPRGNFEGHSIPNLIRADLADEELAYLQQHCRPLLFSHREKRIHPHKDDKILTAWNGLMIAALAKGAQVLQRDDYRQAAAKGVEFIYQKLFNQQGRLLARYRQGEAAYPAYLDDYAFLIWGLLELYRASFEENYLRQALELTDRMIELFWDEQQGGFFFYGKDSEQLIARPKELYDGAMPAGNSVAAFILVQLARLTGEERLQHYAQRQLHTFGGTVADYPNAYAFFMLAALLQATAPLEIAIIGDRGQADTRDMLLQVQTKFLPEATVMYSAQAQAHSKWPLLQNRERVGGQTTAYVCKNYSCHPPVTDAKQLSQLME